MKNGIRLERKKEASLLSWNIAPAKIPSKVWLPIPTSAQFHIEKNSPVKTGQLLAESRADGSDLRIHASISGKVTYLGEVPHPLRGSHFGIEILSTQDEPAHLWDHEIEGWQQLGFSVWLERIQKAGLVTLDPRMLTLEKLLITLRCLKLKEIIILASDSEPYVTSNHSLVMSHSVEVLKGADILRILTGAEKISFIFDQDQEQAAELLKSKIYFLKWDYCEVTLLPAFYPNRFDLELREPHFQDAASTVFNPATLYAMYEAVSKEKPLIEIPVTIGGECVIEPRNRWVRIGTPFEEAFKFCRGLLREPRKVVMGGPMKGFSQKTSQVPVIVSTNAVLALPHEVALETHPEPCIRCGKCLEVCPEDISPAMITLAAENQDWQAATAWGADLCTECGNCAYICPAKRPMMELIQIATTNPSLSKSPEKFSQNDSWGSFFN